MTESEAIKELQDSIDLPFGYVVSEEAVKMAIQALEKQIPKKPYFTEDKEFALCPCCNGKGLFNMQKYCDNCGQKFDWSDEE